jgi:hypothetical protein
MVRIFRRIFNLDGSVLTAANGMIGATAVQYQYFLEEWGLFKSFVQLLGGLEETEVDSEFKPSLANGEYSHYTPPPPTTAAITEYEEWPSTA